MIRTFNLVIIFHDRLPKEYKRVSRKAMVYLKQYYRENANVYRFIEGVN